MTPLPVPSFQHSPTLEFILENPSELKDTDFLQQTLCRGGYGVKPEMVSFKAEL